MRPRARSARFPICPAARSDAKPSPANLSQSILTPDLLCSRLVRSLRRCFNGPLTKAENRAAAKAFHQEQERKRREQARAIAVAADLEQLDALRRYLIFHTKARVPARELIDAIDDYVEKLTGDRRTLHGQNHGIG
jgi:hypothetical protein